METIIKLLGKLTARRAVVAALFFVALINPGVIAFCRFKVPELPALGNWGIVGFLGAISITSILCCTLMLFLSGKGDDFNSEAKCRVLVIAGAGFSAFLLHLLHFCLLTIPGADWSHFERGYVAIHIVMLIAALITIIPQRLVAAWTKRQAKRYFCPEI